MISTNDKISAANKSYMMDVAKAQAIESQNSLAHQSTTDNENQFVDKWRSNRMNRLRHIYEKRREYLDKGAGNLQILTEEKELISITNDNSRVICHFYEEGFERCKVLDRLLTSLASRFLDTKFVKIMATKAPFFTDRIGIRVLPTLLTLIDGNITKIYVGFEELGGDQITMDSIRNSLLKYNILTDECCLLDSHPESGEESGPDN